MADFVVALVCQTGDACDCGKLVLAALVTWSASPPGCIEPGLELIDLALQHRGPCCSRAHENECKRVSWLGRELTAYRLG